MHFHVFHRLYSLSTIIADEHDNTAVSQRVLGKYQTQIPLGITVKLHCPTCFDRLNTLKPTSANTIPTMLDDVVPTCCVCLHGALKLSDSTQIKKYCANVAEASTKWVREQEGRSKKSNPKEEKGVLKRNCFE